jgi:hypothetical protein
VASAKPIEARPRVHVVFLARGSYPRAGGRVADGVHCSELQGYLIGRPAPAATYAMLINGDRANVLVAG